MIKTDDMYLDNLTEFIYDEKKIVTYKFLSVTLGVHVNVAKQMLYTFYTREKAKGKTIYATYFLSGFGPASNFQKDKTEKSSSNDDEDVKPSSQSFLADQHFILLCPCSKLEETKKKFSKLLSVHIYALSSKPVEDFQQLKTADKLLSSSSGKTPFDFGPFSCKAALLKEGTKRNDTQEVPATKSSNSISDNSKPKQKSIKSEPTDSSPPTSPPPNKDKVKTNLFFGNQSANKSSKTSVTPSTKQKTKSSDTTGKSKGGTQKGLGFLPVDKNSTVSQSSVKPKVQSEPVKRESIKKEPVDTKRKSSQKKEDSKPRKRIRVESDSDEEEEKPKNRKRNSFKRIISSDDDSSEESAVEPDSPPRRKAVLIDSDSNDDDDFQNVKKEKSPEKPTLPPCAPGRRRVMKTVTTAEKDEDGYIVTKTEHVMESESDDEANEEAETNTNGDAETQKISSPVKSKSQGDIVVQAAKPNKSNGVKSTPTKGKKDTGKGASQSKTKQQSITSFFQRK